jgi:hypothetical protein
VQVNNTILVEGDATIYYGHGWQKDDSRSRLADGSHTFSIDLSKPKIYNRYPSKILNSPLPPTTASSLQIPLISMSTRAYDKKRMAAFLASDNHTAIYHHKFAIYLMIKPDSVKKRPTDIQYICAETYHTWWRPLVIIPAYPLTVVFDVVTSPFQFIKALDNISKIGQ